MPFMGQPDFRIYEMNRRLQQWSQVSSIKINLMFWIFVADEPLLYQFSYISFKQYLKIVKFS